MDSTFTDLSLPRSYIEIFSPIRIDDPFFAAFWLASYGVFLYGIKRVVGGALAAPFRIFSVEAVAAILALAPAFFVLADVANHGEIQWRTIGVFTLTFASILLGIQAWRMLNASRGGEAIPTRWARFSSILSGGIVGLIGVFAVGFAFDIVVALLRPFMLYVNFRLPSLLRLNRGFDPADSENLLFLAFWSVSIGVMFFVLRRRMRRMGFARIQFIITDYWAAMLALFPSFLFLTDMTERNNFEWRNLVLFAMTSASTISGIATFLMLKRPESAKPLFGRRTRFLSVLFSGWIGFAGLFISAVAFALLAMAIAAAWNFGWMIIHIIYAWLWLCWFVPPLFFITIVCFRIEKKGFDLFTK